MNADMMSIAGAVPGSVKYFQRSDIATPNLRKIK